MAHHGSEGVSGNIKISHELGNTDIGKSMLLCILEHPVDQYRQSRIRPARQFQFRDRCLDKRLQIIFCDILHFLPADRLRLSKESFIIVFVPIIGLPLDLSIQQFFR